MIPLTCLCASKKLKETDLFLNYCSREINGVLLRATCLISNLSCCSWETTVVQTFISYMFCRAQVKHEASFTR